MSSPTRPASPKEQDNAAFLRAEASYLDSNERETFAQYHRIADALDALREAVKGCGGPCGYADCGSVSHLPNAEPLLCPACEGKMFAALLTLTGVHDR